MFRVHIEEANYFDTLIDFTETVMRSIGSTEVGSLSRGREFRYIVDNSESGTFEYQNFIWQSLSLDIAADRAAQVRKILEDQAPVGKFSDPLGRGREHSGPWYRGPREANLGPGVYFRSQAQVYLNAKRGGPRIARYPHKSWKDSFQVETPKITTARFGEKERVERAGGRYFEARPSKAAVVYIHNLATHEARLLEGSAPGRMPKHQNNAFADERRRFWMVFAGADGKPVFIPTPAEIVRRREVQAAREQARTRKRRRDAGPRPRYLDSMAYRRYEAVRPNLQIQATLSSIAASFPAFEAAVDSRVQAAFRAEFSKRWEGRNT